MRQVLNGSSRRRALRRNGSVELLESRLLLTVGPSVDGRANIFAAGLSFVPGDGSGILPPSISIPVGTKYIEFSSITGAVSFDSVNPYTRPFFAPDGGDGLTNIDSLNGISGLISNRHGFLAGVFLESTPPTSNAPDRINAIGDTGFLTTSPSIQQSFFIGDGRTGIGAGYVQKFMVPAGATRLFVGLVDGYDETSATISGPPRYYNDNAGAFAFNYTTYNTKPPLSVTGRANIFGAGRPGNGQEFFPQVSRFQRAQISSSFLLSPELFHLTMMNLEHVHILVRMEEPLALSALPA